MVINNLNDFYKKLENEVDYTFAYLASEIKKEINLIIESSELDIQRKFHVKLNVLNFE